MSGPAAGKVYQKQFPTIPLPVVVGVGSSGAHVNYAGQAPDLVSGVAQFDVVIPSDATTGMAPLTLVVGGTFRPQALLSRSNSRSESCVAVSLMACNFRGPRRVVSTCSTALDGLLGGSICARSGLLNSHCDACLRWVPSYNNLERHSGSAGTAALICITPGLPQNNPAQATLALKPPI